MPTRLRTRASTGAAANDAAPAASRRLFGTIHLPARVTQPFDTDLTLEPDKSTSMTSGVPSEPIRQTFCDVKRALLDTDRGP